MKPNEILASVLILAGLVICVLKYLVEIGFIKVPEKPGPQPQSATEKVFEFLIELVKKDQGPYAVGIALIFLGLVLWFGPTMFGFGVGGANAAPTAIPSATP